MINLSVIFMINHHLINLNLVSEFSNCNIDLKNIIIATSFNNNINAFFSKPGYNSIWNLIPKFVLVTCFLVSEFSNVF